MCSVSINNSFKYRNNIRTNDNCRCSFMMLGEIGYNNCSDKRYHTLKGLSELDNSMDHCIVDQWGVLHDGKVAYKGAIHALTTLKASNKRIIMLSNSSKRRLNSIKGLERVGFNVQLFDDIITSGELAFEQINSRAYDFLPPKKRKATLKVVVIGNGEDDDEYIRDCGCELAKSLDEADFVLVRGMFAIYEGSSNCLNFRVAEHLLENIQPFLGRCVKHDLRMILSNPDFNRPGSGDPMPGQIGVMYESMGGVVEYIGKPFAAVYEKCYNTFTLLNEGREIDKHRICGIGDSLEHDIVGANNFGITSIFTANGVHAHDLGTNEGSESLPAAEKVDELLEKLHIRPDIVIPNFSW